MSLLNKANIITTPTAYSVGKLHSVKPENEIYADFDFARNSSATRVGENGLIQSVAANLPRINYENGIGHLLLEGQRTNLYTYSNDVSFWTKSNVVTTSNYAISPDGTQNAFRAVSSSINSLLYITSTGTIGTNNTLSVWAKSNGGISNKFRFFGNGTTIKSNDYVATNEWQRFEFTYNCTSVTSGLTGASDSATNDILFYGFQHEEGSYATSYIVSNSGSATTRIAEVCNGSGNASTFNSSEGVLMVQISALANDGTYRTFSLSDGSTNNEILLYYYGNNILAVDFSVGAVNQAPFSTTVNQLINNKIAFKYKVNDFSLWVNGIKVATDTSGSVPAINTFNDLSMIRSNATLPFYGKTKQIAYFPEALTDSELECLTSWSSFNRMAIDLNYTIQ
jgi:hypothetical protein